MTTRTRRARLSAHAIATAKPRAREYTLWDGTLAHFGVRVHPSGARSFIVQARAQGRMRKLTLGRFPEMGLEQARRDAAAALARLWGGEAIAPPRKRRAPTFRDFAARYRERRRYRWKPSSLETYDVYLRGRLLPAFGKLRLDAIDHACVSAWFDAASAEPPGAANRAFEILRAMSSRYRSPARPPPTSQAGPVTAGTSTVTASRPARPTARARLAAIESTRRAASATPGVAGAAEPGLHHCALHARPTRRTGGRGSAAWPGGAARSPAGTSRARSGRCWPRRRA